MDKSAHDGKKCVKERQTEDGKWYKERKDGMRLENALDSNERQQISKCLCARISHEYLCGMSIERKKSYAGTDYDSNDERRSEISENKHYHKK